MSCHDNKKKGLVNLGVNKDLRTSQRALFLAAAPCGTTDALDSLERSYWLAVLPTATGSLLDVKKQALNSLGYTGTVVDMEDLYWAAKGSGFPELVVNGTFIDGTAGWVSQSAFTATAVVKDQELQVTPTVNFGAFEQGVPTVSGQNYVVTGHLRLVSGGGNNVYIAYTGNAANSGDVTTLAVNDANNDTPFSWSFTATGSLSYFALRARTGLVAGFKNISVKHA